MWWNRRPYFTGLFLVTSTFMITYLYMKATCIMSDLSALQQDQQHIQMDIKPLNTVKNIESGTNGIVGHPNNKQSVQLRIVENNRMPKSEIRRNPSSPVTKIAFLKVHKAGSSTIQNILFRFGMRNGLTFVLPVEWHYIRPGVELLPLKPGGHYDIFACHTVYSQNRFDMLPNGYKTLAIIREPLRRMVSAAYFYRDKMRRPYLLNVTRERLIPDLINRYEVYDKNMFSRTRNSMGSDFGFEKIAKQGEGAIQEYLKHLESKFELVLVMERFDESLVLMKRMYNWSFRDIIYLKSNTNSHPQISPTSKEIEIFKNISFLDYKIYDMFKEKFDVEVKRFGEEFQKEVRQFKRVLGDVRTFCTTSSANEGLEIEASMWNKRFEVNYEDCVLMKLNDLKFVEKMQRRHRQMNNLPEPTETISKSKNNEPF